MNDPAETNSSGLSIAACLQQAVRQVTHSNPDNDSAGLDCKLLLAHCLEQNLTYIHTWPDKILASEQVAKFRELIAKRCAGHPVAHLIGYRDFWTVRLKVSNATLIPRPETELLVETALALDLPDHARVLDLGTGSGAIAIALASERPQWQVEGIEQSAQALELAIENAKLNNLDRLKFIQSNWFSRLKPDAYHLIVSNPPYVETHSDYLHQGDIRFEPLSALTSGEDGLDDIRMIIQQAKAYLTAPGWLVLEHGYQQQSEITNIFKSNGYIEIRTVIDFNGLPRVSLAKYCDGRT